MEIKIRDDISKHMQEIRDFVESIENVAPESMDGFFTKRVEGYEEHMSIWSEAYSQYAKLFCQRICNNDTDSRLRILDLGCGTGLEIDELYKLCPNLAITGVDLCDSMLEKLRLKHQDREIQVLCEDYFVYDFGKEQYDAVISFESLHHFLAPKKQELYKKIARALKPNGALLLADYIACCDEEERMLQEACRKKREQYQVPEEQFIHFDIPLTLQNETQVMKNAGFSKIELLDSINGATILLATK